MARVKLPQMDARNLGIFAALLVVLLATMSAWATYQRSHKQAPAASSTLPAYPSSQASPAPSPSLSPLPHMSDNFATTYSLQEASSAKLSTNPNWWLSSGGLFYSKSGIAQTIQGMLASGSKWQVAYQKSNPIDTDGGTHPQNIFRLVARAKYAQESQQAFFRIDADNLSSSPNRNQSNGLFFFNRYQDADNLYYTGIRVDGFAVIKKKYHGTYYTMAEKQIFSGTYDHDSSPNLLPHHVWIGLRSQVTTNQDGSVNISLWSDLGQSGNWQLVDTATDNGLTYGGPAILQLGYGGIRTDFMDVSFRQYLLSQI
jgi:hypothetical protein